MTTITQHVCNNVANCLGLVGTNKKQGIIKIKGWIKKLVKTVG